MVKKMTSGTDGKLTNEMVQELLKEKGKEFPARQQWNELASRDAIRHWADGIGDLNPLWKDLDYANKTRYRGIVAAPTFLFSCHSHIGRMGLPGIHGLYAGSHWFWYVPVYEGDWIKASGGLYDIVEKEGRFAGKSYLQTMFINYRNQRDVLVATVHNWIMRTERDTGHSTGKYKSWEKHVYSPEELDEIRHEVEAEEIRGSTPRYWEDVQIGDLLTPVVKGPMVISDMVAFKMGWGAHQSHHIRGANEVRYEVLRRHPKAYILNRLNVPDMPERVHVDEDAARRVGIPGFYDYGPQRVSWMGHLMTNWIGDDGWLKELEVQVRRPNIEGDTQWCKGRVTKKYVGESGEHLVECEIWAENQRGEVTAPGRAVAVLPHRSS